MEARTASADDVADAERQSGVLLPEQYKVFIVHYGGGQFGFIDLLPVVTAMPGDVEDMVSVNRDEFPDRSFVAVAPVGTGDNGQCRDEVWFRFHDAGDPEREAADYLEFVVTHGLRT